MRSENLKELVALYLRAQDAAELYSSCVKAVAASSGTASHVIRSVVAAHAAQKMEELRERSESVIALIEEIDADASANRSPQ